MPNPKKNIPLTLQQVKTLSWAIPALLDSMKNDTQYWENNPMWTGAEKRILKVSAFHLRDYLEKILKTWDIFGQKKPPRSKPGLLIGKVEIFLHALDALNKGEPLEKSKNINGGDAVQELNIHLPQLRRALTLVKP